LGVESGAEKFGILKFLDDFWFVQTVLFGNACFLFGPLGLMTSVLR
jgi:hypothetical protein